MLRRYSSRINPGLPREVILDGKGDWRLRDGHGRELSAELLPDSLIHPQIVALRFRAAGRLQRAVIVRNRDNADMLRRLQVRLRHAVDG